MLPWHGCPEIAADFRLRTIERHVENLYRGKLEVHGRAEAIAYAFRHAWPDARLHPHTSMDSDRSPSGGRRAVQPRGIALAGTLA
ncbi:MAG: hypothetical protein U0841_21935 [Chloroflexia bacterium]